MGNILLVADPGTGKTVSFLSVTEYFRKMGTYKGAFIFERGKLLLDNVKKELKNRFGFSAINRKSSFYRFMSYTSLVFLVNGWTRARKEAKVQFSSHEEMVKSAAPLSDDELNEIFGNRILVLDEVHNIIGSSSNNKDEDQSNALAHEAFMRIINAVKNLKVILATATPMINSSSELRPLTNLILEPGARFPHNFPFKTTSIEPLAERLSGKVSYVRSSVELARTSFPGKQLSPDGTVVFPSVMSDFQEAVYVKMYESERNKNESKIGLVPNSLQSSLFVFPDGSIGNVGFKKYVKSSSASNIYKLELTPILRNAISKDLKKLSTVFSTIVEIELSHIKNVGTSFIYSDFKRGGGALLMALALGVFGFELFVPNLKDSSLENLEKKPRVAILVPENESHHSTILEIFNRPENHSGEFIKIIVGSRVARDGINLFHCLRVHLLTPGWTPSGITQAYSRVLRATSFSVLRGLIPAEEITVSIFKHVSLAKDIPSIGEVIYNRAFRKDREIKRIGRFLKQIASDCEMNYARNVLSHASSDVDFSPDCDYQLCKYTCIKTPRKELRFREFNLNLMYAAYRVVSERGGQISIAKGGVIFENMFPEIQAALFDYDAVFYLQRKEDKKKQGLSFPEAAIDVISQVLGKSPSLTEYGQILEAEKRGELKTLRLSDGRLIHAAFAGLVLGEYEENLKARYIRVLDPGRSEWRFANPQTEKTLSEAALALEVKRPKKRTPQRVRRKEECVGDYCGAIHEASKVFQIITPENPKGRACNTLLLPQLVEFAFIISENKNLTTSDIIIGSSTPALRTELPSLEVAERVFKDLKLSSHLISFLTESGETMSKEQKEELLIRRMLNAISIAQNLKKTELCRYLQLILTRKDKMIMIT